MVTFPIRLSGPFEQIENWSGICQRVGWIQFKLSSPKDANLGTARVVFHYDVTNAVEGRYSTERIKIEEFRRPCSK